MLRAAMSTGRRRNWTPLRKRSIRSTRRFSTGVLICERQGARMHQVSLRLSSPSLIMNPRSLHCRPASKTTKQRLSRLRPTLKDSALKARSQARKNRLPTIRLLSMKHRLRSRNLRRLLLVLTISRMSLMRSRKNTKTSFPTTAQNTRLICLTRCSMRWDSRRMRVPRRSLIPRTRSILTD